MKNILLDTSSGRIHVLSQEEIDRRIRAVRSLMEEKELELLLIVNPGRGGYRYWFTGVSGPERASQGGILVGRQKDVVSVMGGALVSQGESQGENYSMAKVSGACMYQGIREVNGFYEQMIKELLRGSRRVGLVNGEWLRADLLDFMAGFIPEMELADVTPELERIKAQKSPEERELMRENALMMDKIFHAAYQHVKPLVYERDIANAMRYSAYQLGCGGPDYLESARLYLVSSREGEPLEREEPVWPGRFVTQGDRVDLKMYCLGTSSYYGALARSAVLGRPTANTVRLWETAKEAQKLAADMLKPGAILKGVAKAVNAYLGCKGCQEDTSVFLHSMGYNVDEAPRLGHPSENEAVLEGTVLVIEPSAADGVTAPVCCGDTFVVTESGAKRLNAFPQELILL